MGPLERRTFWACFAGWTLDGMDFMIYPLVIGSVIAHWHIDLGTAGFAVTATLVMSAIGGWVAGHLADRFGRVRTLQVTILWFAFFSLLCAFATTFEQLAIARALLGLGFGGEWAVGAVLMAETVPASYRGRAVGCVQAGWAAGWGLAVVAQLVLFSLMDAEHAWRAMFVLGAFPALLVLYVRRHVQEPVVATRMREARAESGAASIWKIFSAPMRKATFLGSMLTTGGQGGYYAIATWMPTFLATERGLTAVASTGYLASLIVGSGAGYLVGAWLADRIGRRILFIVFSSGSIVMTGICLMGDLTKAAMYFLALPLGFFASGYYAGLGPFLSEMFPTAVRGSGQGFTYNVGRGLGALFPALVGFMSLRMPLSAAIATFAIAAHGLLLVAAIALPETRGRAFADPDGDSGALMAHPRAAE